MYTEGEDIDGKQMSGPLGTRIQVLQARLGDFDDTIRRLARDRPLAILGGALAIGFVLGRAMSR